MWFESFPNRTGFVGVGIVFWNFCDNLFMGLYGRCVRSSEGTEDLHRWWILFCIFIRFRFWRFSSDCVTVSHGCFVSPGAPQPFFFHSKNCVKLPLIVSSLSHLPINHSLAGAQSVSFTYIVEFHSSVKAARAAAFVASFSGAIWIVTSLLSMLIIPMEWTLWIASFPFRPWRLILLCCSLLNLWNAIVFSYLPESPKFLLATNRKDEALNVLSRIYAFNTGKSKEVRWDRIFH